MHTNAFRFYLIIILKKLITVVQTKVNPNFECLNMCILQA